MEGLRGAYVGWMPRALLLLLLIPAQADGTPLFNGRDLSGWKADDEARRHWTVKDGVLDYDGRNRDLWTEASYGDFELKLSWRWSGAPKPADHPVFDADGNEVKGKTERMMDAGDSGVFLRGYRKAQANLFCYPCGSGEVWEYRTDPAMPADVRRACMPLKRMDKPPGEWNAMVIVLRGERLNVRLNGETVIRDARLPGIPARGPIGLQHEHGTVQFKDLWIRELP